MTLTFLGVKVSRRSFGADCVKKFLCGFCGWIVWRDKNGSMSHKCFANCKELIMDENRTLFRKETCVENEFETAGNSTAYNEESTVCEKPSFRHYNVMTFLDDTLEYRQTITSLQRTLSEDQAFTLDNNNIPSTSLSDNVDVLFPISNNNNNSTSPTASKSRKRKSIDLDLDKYEETLVKSLTQKTESNPVDGFVSRLAEGLRRLSYKTRSKLEIEFLSRLFEAEEEEERHNKM